MIKSIKQNKWVSLLWLAEMIFAGWLSITASNFFATTIIHILISGFYLAFRAFCFDFSVGIFCTLMLLLAAYLADTLDAESKEKKNGKNNNNYG